jgi:hypothetical protein
MKERRLERVSMPSSSLHTHRPSVYLDLWAWIDLAKAAAKRATSQADAEMLAAFLHAADAGVAFPLSAAHYVEMTHKITNPRQRHDVASVMAAVSHCRTLGSRRTLLRNQLLAAMHEYFERPRFQPHARDALGVGVHWAFGDKVQVLHMEVPGVMPPRVREFLATDLIRRMNQWAQFSFLAGPKDNEIGALRQKYGYRPEATAAAGESRVEFETIYADILKAGPLAPRELRFRVQVRELIHELAQLFGETFREHGMSLDRLIFQGNSVESRRSFVSEFLDSMPSVRVAVDLKTGLFHNNKRGVTVNDLYDIDAMSFAVPYCDVVVADKAVENALWRVDTAERFGTMITKQLSDVVAVLPHLEARALQLPDASGWDQLGPGHGFHPISPDDLALAAVS